MLHLWLQLTIPSHLGSEGAILRLLRCWSIQEPGAGGAGMAEMINHLYNPFGFCSCVWNPKNWIGELLKLQE